MPHRPCILVVDDSTMNRLLLRTYLQQLGYDVLEAENGQHALKTLAQHDVRMVFMDLVMPAMDGLDCLDAIRADQATRNLPVVIVSSLDDRDDIAYGLERGADAYLTLPLVYEDTRQVTTAYLPLPA